MITKKSKKKKSFQAIFLSILFGLFALAIAIFLIVSNIKINRRRKDLISQIGTLEKEIQILELKNEELKAGVDQSLTESYLEKEARERLGLKKPGEEVVVIKKIETQEPEEVEQEKSLWDKIWEKLKFWRD
ncbi:septum formation initiator family protein [Patescibacteria group bacterium]|nr:septum formation initiator family protein [Patescibacteria group bacterium]